jgi:prolyl-tRNA editing enzyme YbaK/EbsC (Cys-tRNA(Pro) deacylase)
MENKKNKIPETTSSVFRQRLLRFRKNPRNLFYETILLGLTLREVSQLIGFSQEDTAQAMIVADKESAEYITICNLFDEMYDNGSKQFKRALNKKPA